MRKCNGEEESDPEAYAEEFVFISDNSPIADDIESYTPDKKKYQQKQKGNRTYIHRIREKYTKSISNDGFFLERE